MMKPLWIAFFLSTLGLVGLAEDAAEMNLSVEDILSGAAQQTKKNSLEFEQEANGSSSSYFDFPESQGGFTSFDSSVEIKSGSEQKSAELKQGDFSVDPLNFFSETSQSALPSPKSRSALDDMLAGASANFFDGSKSSEPSVSEVKEPMEIKRVPWKVLPLELFDVPVERTLFDASTGLIEPSDEEHRFDLIQDQNLALFSDHSLKPLRIVPLWEDNLLESDGKTDSIQFGWSLRPGQRQKFKEDSME
jgi:hypothetical protein